MHPRRASATQRAPDHGGGGRRCTGRRALGARASGVPSDRRNPATAVGQMLRECAETPQAEAKATAPAGGCTKSRSGSRNPITGVIALSGEGQSDAVRSVVVAAYETPHIPTFPSHHG